MTACANVGSVRGEKVAMITHILRPVVCTNLACIHTSAEAKEAADTLQLITNAEALARSSVASTDDSVPLAQAKRARSGTIAQSSQTKKLKGPLTAFTYKGVDMPFSATEK